MTSEDERKKDNSSEMVPAPKKAPKKGGPKTKIATSVFTQDEDINVEEFLKVIKANHIKNRMI